MPLLETPPNPAPTPGAPPPPDPQQPLKFTTRRFGELQGEVGGIAPNVLTQRLRQLERNALLIARPYSERPPRFEYELSTAGQELAGVLRLLAGWGARQGEEPVAPRHSVCGTPMEARWWCPTCERPVADDEGDELHYA